MVLVMRTPLIAATILIFTLTTGCAEIGNFFVPPHSHSDHDNASKTCLYLTGLPVSEGTATLEAAPAIAGIAASAAMGYLVDRTASAIKDESKRYQASYSARDSRDLAAVQGGSTEYLWNTLTLIRYLGDDLGKQTCAQISELKEEQQPEKAVQLVAELVTQPAPEIKVRSLILNKTKAKVASVRWFIPWSWWMLVDRSNQRVDMKATVTLSAILQTEKGPQSKDIISADIPLGKFKLKDNSQEIQINDASSGPFILPSLGCSNCKGLHTTATITISESNELGDIIAEASKKVSENKQSITNLVLGELKIAPPTSK